MARRNFYEIITSNEFNLRAEYSRIYEVYYQGTSETYPIAELVESNFVDFPGYLVGRTISVDDFDNTYNFRFPERPAKLTSELLITFCEYIWNMCEGLYHCGNIDEDDVETIQFQRRLIVSAMTDLGMSLHQINNIYFFVEERPEVVATVEVVKPELVGGILRYHHHSLKGDLSAKKNILKQMADDIECERNILKGINGVLESQLYQMMNKFVRHTHSQTPYIATMSPEEIEACYDDIYQMWLLAKLEMDNLERKNRIAALLPELNKKN